MYKDPVTRGQAMAVFIGGTCVGPLAAPIISGFISPALGWHWTFWIGLIFASVSWISLIFLPKTYGPNLLLKHTKKLRRETGNPEVLTSIELEKQDLKQMITVTLTQPLRMLLFELIVLAACSYVPRPRDTYLRITRAANKPWTQKEESRRLPLAILDRPLYVVSLFCIPFGIEFILIFIALLNYLTDADEVFAASAIAASSCCRRLTGAVLPFAAKPMYTRLGVP
ncbi:MFS multidrug transporter [Sclerotinia borealis F-4128]|uniref:MFS multidrug transporter n=1 Tax=Sclerotinia borealis (strain F-4128) TaxID=1432307 RepID=W9CBV9_SCLBF|nr:MFS multidrug transporter [Sclerotinia borealis F-4128]